MAKFGQGTLRSPALQRILPTLEFDDLAAATYGSIVAAVGYSRRRLLDRMIPDDFSDVPGLTLCAW